MADCSISKAATIDAGSVGVDINKSVCKFGQDWINLEEAKRARKMENEGNFSQAEKIYRKHVLDEATKYKTDRSDAQLESLNQSRQQLSAVLFAQRDFIEAEELLRQSMTDLETQQNGRIKNEDAFRLLNGWMKLEDQTVKLAEVDKLFAKHAENARFEIRKYGTDPAKWLVSAMHQNRVLAIGESHIYSGTSDHHRLGSSLMQQLKQAGATHLAVELADNHQDVLDRFMETGNLDTSLLESSKGTSEYLSSSKFCESKDLIMVLESARKAGLKLVAVDDADSLNTGFPSNLFGSSRDKAIAGHISHVLKGNAKNKVVFWTGAIHAQVLADKRDNERACQILREQGFPIVSVLPKAYDAVSDQDPCRILDLNLRVPTLVPTVKAKEFSKLPELRTVYPSVQNFKAWDAVIFYP